MSLRDRLRQIYSLPEAPEPEEPAILPTDPPLEDLVDGVWRQVGDQRCFVAEARFALDRSHGDARFGDLLALPTEIWTPLVSEETGAPLDPRRALFVDTETTGLMRGAGTLVFMVGVGLFEGDAFCVRQYFVPDYAHEEAFLHLLGQDLARREGLISFNGRAFDWPLIQMRYGLWGEQPPGPASDPHLDLLLVSRRLWRRRLDSCSLSSLETGLLGVRRRGEDVPGYLIPQLYWDYLRDGRTRPMARVFYHNQVDILSLVTLAGKIGALLHEPPAPADDPHFDAYALGRLYERHGQTERALAAYRIAVQDGRRDDARLANESLSLLLKRLERHEEAAAIWEAELGREALYPYVELAKHCEHRLRDYGRAREITLGALAWLDSSACSLDRYARRQARGELQHRLARLERRLERAEPSSEDDEVDL